MSDVSRTDTQDLPVGEISDDKKDAVFLGHPKGLAYIVFTEAWERFSFYGMQALLILYMATHLFLPENSGNVAVFEPFRSFFEFIFGPLSVQALASQVFGVYVGLVYFAPVLGGLIGDRVLGRRKAVLSGALFMAAGHFLMAFEASFLFALLMLVLGSGLLKGNLAAQVGALYAKSDKRRDSGYSIYVFSINVGASVAPLVCGTLGEVYGWHYGFGAAGIGMLIGLVVYLMGHSHLPVDTITAKDERPKLQKGDGVVILSILAMLALTSLYWAAQSQVWNAYPLWLRTDVDRSIFGMNIPVTWFQSLDSTAVLILAPLVLWYWRVQSRRKAEPSDLIKLAIGCGVFASAFVLLGLGDLLSGGEAVALVWPVIFHFICGVGFLYVGPIALALTSRAAPESVNSMMVGSYYLAIFFGGLFSGWLARFYEQMSSANFWLMHAAIVGIAAVLIIGLRPVLTRLMKLDAEDATPPAEPLQQETQ
ncbi:peptide MFS transporter [Henriciella sp.]|uniref:peptide MFS transporter n=1 Tax=Henriciella sp. TaxID=1968823 RepID=UPI00263838B0|nr:peptide MFS transporter [Henriciella sp.]